MMSSCSKSPTDHHHQSILTMSFSTILVILMLNVQGLIAFPSGAPPDTCSNNLLPIHGGNEPSSEPAPYILTATSNTYSSNKPINVVLKGLSGNMFKGFVIQAQDAITGEPINSGEWNSGTAKELPCAAVTHISPNPKSRVELTWTPKGNGQVQFVATVVQSFDTFYSGIKSIVRSSGSSSAASSSSSASSDGITNHNRHKPSRPNNNGHRDNSAQDNFPFESPSSFPVSQPKDDSNSDQSGAGFFPSSSFGSQPLAGSPSFNVEDQQEQGGNQGIHNQQNFFPHPAFRPPHHFGGGGGGGFNNKGFKPDERQQESSSQIFSSFQGPNNNNMHRFAPPQEPPHPLMRAPMHLPHHLI